MQRAYTKEALDNFSNYTSVVDTPDIVLAKINSVNQSDVCTSFSTGTVVLLELVDDFVAFLNHSVFSFMYFMYLAYVCVCVHLLH